MALYIPREYRQLQVGIEFPDTSNPVKLPDGFKLNLGCAFECECHNELKKLKQEIEMINKFPYDKKGYEETKKCIIDYLIPRLTDSEIGLTTEQLCFLIKQFDDYAKLVNKIPVVY